MKSVWFSDDLSFEKKIPLDYHVTIGSAWHQWQIRFPLLKKTFEYTIYMQVNFLQHVYIQIDKIDMYYGVQLMFINAVGSKWTLLLVVEGGIYKLMLLTECIKSWPLLLWIGHDLRRLNLLFIETDQPRNIKIEVGF